MNAAELGYGHMRNTLVEEEQENAFVVDGIVRNFSSQYIYKTPFTNASTQNDRRWKGV